MQPRDQFFRDGAISVQLDFLNPFWPARHLRDRGAFHRLDELGFSFRKTEMATFHFPTALLVSASLFHLAAFVRSTLSIRAFSLREPDVQ